MHRGQHGRVSVGDSQQQDGHIQVWHWGRCTWRHCRLHGEICSAAMWFICFLRSNILREFVIAGLDLLLLHLKYFFTGKFPYNVFCVGGGGFCPWTWEREICWGAESYSEESSRNTKHSVTGLSFPTVLLAIALENVSSLDKLFLCGSDTFLLTECK